MKIKRYFAPDIRQAIRMVRDEQGPDAVILSNRSVKGGIEIVAAVDYDETALFERETPVTPPSPPPKQVTPPPRQNPYQQTLIEDEALDREDSVKVTLSEQVPSPSRHSKPNRPEKMQQTLQRDMGQASQLQDLFGDKKKKPREPDQNNIWSQEPTLVEMKQELKTLRGLIEKQLSGFAWSEVFRDQPAKASLLQALSRLGLSASCCYEMCRHIGDDESQERGWQRALAQLSSALPVLDDDILTNGGVVALVGPTGVGKTTSVAKLAARYAIRYGAEHVALVTTDTYRIGAQEQLRTYARILNVPIRVADNIESLDQVLRELADKHLVLIDTAGMSQRDVRLTEQFKLLKQSLTDIHSYLVLPATTRLSTLDETVSAFEKSDLDGCILTKLDETTSLGAVLSVAWQHRLPITYISDGQRVPEDLAIAESRDLVKRAVQLMEEAGTRLDDETLALSMSQGGVLRVNL